MFGWVADGATAEALLRAPPAALVRGLPTGNEDEGELGRCSIAAEKVAGRYVDAGRAWLVERVRRIIGGAVTENVHTRHNCAWRKRHGGRDVWVVRKGAPHRPGPASAASSAGPWATTPLSSRVSPARPRPHGGFSTVKGAGRLHGCQLASFKD